MDKATFRRLAVEAEGRIGTGPASAMSEVAQALLHALPLARWRTRRRDNHRFLSAQLAAVPGLRVAAPQDPEGCSPLSAILLFATPELRERVRSALLARDIYPAILWPLDDVPGAGARERALSHTLLSLPCDMRYGEPDLARAAAQVRAAAAEQPSWSAAP